MTSAICKNDVAVLKQSKVSFILSPRTTEPYVTRGAENRLKLRNTILEAGGAKEVVLYIENM